MSLDLISVEHVPFLANLMLPNFHLIYNTENFPFEAVERLGFELPELSMAFDYTGFKVVFEFGIEGLVEVQWIFRLRVAEWFLSHLSLVLASRLVIYFIPYPVHSPAKC